LGWGLGPALCYTKRMHPVPVKLRRARRTDFVAVMKVLASTNLPVPPADRSTLRRFRRVVADLGGDFYVALSAGQVIGFVHVTYARQLATAARARVEALAVQSDRQGCGIGSALLDLACRRAHRRGCTDVRCETGEAERWFSEFLSRRGWVHERYVLQCAPRAAAVEVTTMPATVAAPS
jgi:N-acetylglutamate synthase-like GNAT family acetyltransferase